MGIIIKRTGQVVSFLLHTLKRLQLIGEHNEIRCAPINVINAYLDAYLLVKGE